MSRFHPKNFPILTTIAILLLAVVVSQIVGQLTGRQEYAMLVCAALTIGIAFLFRMPREMLLTSRIDWGSLKYYWVPALYMATMPLLTGGYNFSALSKEVFLMMAGVGIFEEVLTHGICMGLLLRKWGTGRKQVIKAAVVSSMLFGLFHLMAILQDPSNSHLVLYKGTTVVFATLIGIGFAGLSYRSHSIWLVALSHALIDVMFNVGSPEMLQRITTQWNWTMSVVSVLYTLPFGYYGIWLLRQQHQE